MKQKAKKNSLCLQRASILLLVIISSVGCKKSSLVKTNIAPGSNSANEASIKKVDIVDGLVAWYKFTNGNTKDLSGNNNDITFNNATKTSDYFGNPNNAYYFNGKGNYMEIPNSSSLNPTGGITLAALVKPMAFYTGRCHGNRIIMKGSNDFANGLYLLGYSDDQYNTDPCGTPVMMDKETFVGSYGNGQTNSAGVSSKPQKVQLDKWYKLVFTYDGDTAKLYMCNVLVNQAPYKINFIPNNTPVRIGATLDSQYPYWFNGVIDEIRIYNKAVDKVQAMKISDQLGM